MSNAPAPHAPIKKVQVAAAVIVREDGRFLLGQRAPDTFYPGYWEFPGGKVEAGETPHQALLRELQEELGISVHQAYPWVVREHVYEHAHVSLHFFEVTGWSGELRDHVHSALSWQRADALDVGPMLPANGPILKALRLPRFMGISQAHQCGVTAQLASLQSALRGGLRLVQLREMALPAAARQQFCAEAVRLCHEHGALVVLNSDADLARQVLADGVHLPAAQLMQCTTRPDFDWVGASCHSHAELAQAARLGVDYALLSPLQATASHPGEAALGWPAAARLMQGWPMPVLALGGLGPADVLAAKAAGAHGVAAIRAAWA